MAETTETRDGFNLDAAATVHPQPAAGSFAALPDGYGVHDLEKFQSAPTRPREAVKVREVAALAGYLNRFGDERAVAFADWRAGRIRAVLDYHEPGGPAGFGEHSCTFAAQNTPAWSAWKAANDKRMSQVDFARFLEERAVEVVTPDAASVVEVCMNLEAIQKVEFKSAVRLSDGFRQFKYVEDNDTRGGVTVPETLTINVAVFEGQEPQLIPVRLRFRIVDGRLTLFVTIDNLDDIERLAFERCIDALVVDAPDGLPVYRAVL